MPAAHKVRVQQYCGSQDLLARLARDLRDLQQAPSAAAALDRTLTFCITAWSLTAWLYPLIARDAALRRQIARLADHSMTSLDAEVFAAIAAGQSPNLELCADISADPTRLAVQSTGAGWLLLLLEGGEAMPLELIRFSGVLTFWRQFVRTYLSDRPVIRRAA